MVPLDQVREELQEEGDQQEADVHTVHIGIGRDDHLVVAQAIQPIFDVEGSLEQVEFFIFIDDLLGQSIAVQRFTAQAEDRLQVRVSALRDGSAGRVTLGDEDTGLFGEVAFRIIQVNAAIPQFAVVQIGLLGPFTCQFGDTGNRLPLLFRIQDLFQ